MAAVAMKIKFAEEAEESHCPGHCYPVENCFEGSTEK